MHPDSWNMSDVLEFELFSPINPFDRGHVGLDEVLDIVESVGDELRPSQISFERRRERKYSRQLMHECLPEFQFMEHTAFILGCARVPDAFFNISGYAGDEASRFRFHLYMKPFAWCREPGKEEERAAQLVSLVRTLATRLPLSHGFAHSNTDMLLDTDPEHPGPSVPPQVVRVLWLNVYGPQLVETLGRERVLSTP
ncbi:MAG TPA: hypothetical protein VEU33_12725, partial [Archangium sp.]|nr:hypothetical protein [Archangium sp.]